MSKVGILHVEAEREVDLRVSEKKKAEEVECCSHIRRKPCANISYSK